MITTDLLRQLPAQYRNRLLQEEYPDDSELEGDYELAADLAEELLRLRRWQRSAAVVLDVLRRNATGQEPLEGEDQERWVNQALALTERRVMDEGASWEDGK